MERVELVKPVGVHRPVRILLLNAGLGATMVNTGIMITVTTIGGQASTFDVLFLSSSKAGDFNLA